MRGLIRRNHRGTSGVSNNWPFKIAINLQAATSSAPQFFYRNIFTSGRGFGTIADPLLNGLTRPVLNATDRYPAEDFAYVVARVPTVASPQTLHCRILGLAASITVTGTGWSITNIVPSGDITTFDLNAVASNPVDSQAIITFTGTKRTAASPLNSGVRGLDLMAHGFALDDPLVTMPYMAAALAPFSTLRMMDLSAVNNNIYTVTPGDRAADGICHKNFGMSSGFPISIETACRICNELGKNLWWNIPSGANDALVQAFATVAKNLLDPDKYCIFELGNENWNSTFWQQPYWVVKGLDIANGFTFQYCETKHVKYYSRTANVVTAEFETPHDFIPGQDIYTSFLLTTGYKVIISTPTSTSATWTDVGADVAPTDANTGSVRSGRLFVSANRLGTVMTIKFGQPHNMTAGITSVKASGFPGLTSVLTPITSVVDPYTITMPCTAGADGPIGLAGGACMASLFTDPLNSYDVQHDQFILARRAYAKRTVEISNLVKAIYDPGDWGVRAKIGLFNQPGINQLDQLTYVNNAWGAPNQYIHGIGQATYIFLDATFAGGPNLRNVTTYNGNTPPSKEDYASTWALTAEGAKTLVRGNWDGTAMTARLFGLKMWEYEFGPDATASPPPGVGGVTGRQKLDTLHDPLFKPHYTVLLNALEAGGWEEVAVYTSATVPVGSSSEYQSWGIYRDWTLSSIRLEAIQEKLASPRTGPTRNLLSRISPVDVDGRMILGIYDTSGAFPSVCVGSTPMQNWIITAPEEGDWSFEPTYNLSSGGTRNIIVQVNGVPIVPNYSIPLGSFTQAPVTVHLTKGHNLFRTVPGTTNPGALVTAINMKFTPIP